MQAGLCDGDAVERGVELPVADAAEPVALLVARPDRQRRGPVVAGIGVLRAESVHAGCLGQDLGGGQVRAADYDEQFRSELVDERRDLALEDRDLAGQPFASSCELRRNPNDDR